MYPSVLIVSGRISSNCGHSMARGEVSRQIVGISSICFFNIFWPFTSFNIWILLLKVTHLSLIFLCCVVTHTHTHTHTHICGYAKYDYWAQSLPGLTIYLYRGFWLSYYGWIYTRQPKYPPIYFLRSLSTHRVSPVEWLISSLSVLSRIANPLFSLNPSIYSFR